MLNSEERIPYQWECLFFNVNTFIKDVEHILYEGERFRYLHERILFCYFLENFSLGGWCISFVGLSSFGAIISQTSSSSGISRRNWSCSSTEHLNSLSEFL